MPHASAARAPTSTAAAARLDMPQRSRTSLRFTWARPMSSTLPTSMRDGERLLEQRHGLVAAPLAGAVETQRVLGVALGLAGADLPARSRSPPRTARSRPATGRAASGSGRSRTGPWHARPSAARPARRMACSFSARASAESPCAHNARPSCSCITRQPDPGQRPGRGRQAPPAGARRCARGGPRDWPPRRHGSIARRGPCRPRPPHRGCRPTTPARTRSGAAPPRRERLLGGLARSQRCREGAEVVVRAEPVVGDLRPARRRLTARGPILWAVSGPRRTCGAAVAARPGSRSS